MKSILLTLLCNSISIFIIHSTCYSQQNSEQGNKNIKNDIINAINLIHEGERYDESKYKVYDSARTMICQHGNKSLGNLIQIWNPSMFYDRSRFVMEAIISNEVFDSTIYEKLYQKNLNDPEPRIAYLNTAMFYASIWDGATSSPDAPRRNWGNCPKKFLELILARIDDTSTLTVHLTKHDDFMRRVIELAKTKIAIQCIDKKTEDEFAACVEELTPKDSIKVSIGEMNKLCFMGLTAPAIDGLIEKEDRVQKVKTTVIESQLLRNWYAKNKNKIVWQRSIRCFVPLTKKK